MNLPGIYGIPKQASVYLLGVFGSESAPRAAVVRRPPVDSRHDARGRTGGLQLRLLSRRRDKHPGQRVVDASQIARGSVNLPLLLEESV